MSHNCINCQGAAHNHHMHSHSLISFQNLSCQLPRLFALAHHDAHNSLQALAAQQRVFVVDHAVGGISCHRARERFLRLAPPQAAPACAR
jgi:hypothetical protein